MLVREEAIQVTMLSDVFVMTGVDSKPVVYSDLGSVDIRWIPRRILICNFS